MFEALRIFNPLNFMAPGIVGPILGGDGTTPATGRQGKTGEAIIAQGHGKYYELASRALLAFACDQGAGVAVPTTLSTTCVAALYNPINSGKRLALVKVSVGYVSGTMGAGAIFHCVTPQVSGTSQTKPSGGTSLTSYWTDVNNLGLAAAPVGLVTTASTVVAPIAYRPIVSTFPELATTANGFQPVTDDMDGEIVLEPGGSYQIQGILGAGGSSPKVTIGIVWAEIPYVASQG